MKRVLTGLLLAVGTWALIFLAPQWAFMLVAVGLSALALDEFFGIATKGGSRPFVLAGHVAAVLWILLPNLDRGYFATLVAVIMLGAGVVARLPFSSVLPSAAVTMVGLLYIAGPMLWGILLHEASPHWLFFVLFVVAIGDISAMAVGKVFGRRKLAPLASPMKTWEGTLASVAASALAGSLYAYEFLATDLGSVEAVVLSVVLNVFGQVGDLFESAIKRAAGMKDSGTVLPGHGGILDRIDGMLFGIPVGYGYVQLMV